MYVHMYVCTYVCMYEYTVAEDVCVVDVLTSVYAI